jgi:hypothetical protein
MSRRERNAAELNSGNAVAHSAPVLNQPTSPQQPVESRRLSPVQHKSGREFEGGALISAEGAVPLSFSLPEWEQKSCPQAQRGGDAKGRQVACLEGMSPQAFEMPSLHSDEISKFDEISKLAEFFLLLDAWDRRRNDSPLM